MKINKENMQEVAQKLDYGGSIYATGLTPMDIMSMAYQLQYFFEAVEKIDAYPDILGSSEYTEGFHSGNG